jgi:hypothetical protein
MVKPSTPPPKKINCMFKGMKANGFLSSEWLSYLLYFQKGVWIETNILEN